MDVLIYTLHGNKTSGARAVTSAGQLITLGGGEPEQIRITNSGPNHVCVLPGDGTQVAAFPTDATTFNGKGDVVLAGATEVFSCAASTLHFITQSGQTATVFVSRGKGA